MDGYTITTVEPMSAQDVADGLFSAYAGRRDPQPEHMYYGGTDTGLYVTEGRLPFPDRRTAIGQRRIVFEVKINGGETTSNARATSFTVQAGTEMIAPEKFPEVVKRVRAALGGN